MIKANSNSNPTLPYPIARSESPSPTPFKINSSPQTLIFRTCLPGGRMSRTQFLHQIRQQAQSQPQSRPKTDPQPHTPSLTPTPTQPANLEPQICRDLAPGEGLPVGLTEVEAIEGRRVKRAFEASLPAIDNAAERPQRQRMLEAWEEGEWAARDGEILGLQEERLQLLRNAILVGGGGI